MTDRLDDLKREQEDDLLIDPEIPNNETKEYSRQYDSLKSDLKKIKGNVNKIRRLKDNDMVIADESKRKKNSEQLDTIMEETTKIAVQLKQKLDGLKRQNDNYAREHKGEVATTQMRQNLYQTYVRKFHKVMNEYNNEAQVFKQNMQARTRRQLKIIKQDITDEEVDRIVSSGKATGIIKEALISENLENVVRDIEERHMDILKLEKQVLEVYQLFQDLATLVDIQQESLDVIQHRILHAKEYAENAEKELKQAEGYQKKSKKRCCCILVILVVALLVITIPILSSIIP